MNQFLITYTYVTQENEIVLANSAEEAETRLLEQMWAFINVEVVDVEYLGKAE